MADKRNYNASLNARGLEKEVSEEQARRMCSSQGQHSLFLIDAHHGKLVTDEDGTQRIHLIIDTAELVPVEYEDRVRRFMRALYLARPDQFGQEAFDGATAGEPTVTDTASALDAVVETTDAGEVTGVWDPAQDEKTDPAADGPWPGDADYVAPDTDDKGNVIAFSG